MIRQLFTSLSVLMFCSGMLCSCADESLSAGSDPVVDADFLDTFSDHLHFSHATRIPGTAPTGPSVHSLKISFKDTLYLTDTVSGPVKFQHLNSSENISGIYVQVFIGGSGGIINASHYYDVPEEEATANSDSVSTFLIGIREDGLPLPARCSVRIGAHKKDGTVIAESIKEIIVEEPPKAPSAIGNGCGLVLQPEQSWYWRSTSFTVGNRVNRYFPETVFKGPGQDIPGCCVDGESDSGPTCLTTEPENKRILNYATSYQIVSETFKFFDNGTFVRTTLENTTNPAPDKSNYCSSGPGVVVDFVGLNAYNGKWQVVDAPEFSDDSERLTFANITSTGTGAGFGHRGGYIYYLICPPGAPRELALADPDPEGGGGLTFKYYVALDDDFKNSGWYPF